jgi:hypothetical protein
MIHLIGNGTRDLPACSTVPQPNTLPRAPIAVDGIPCNYRPRNRKSSRVGDLFLYPSNTFLRNASFRTSHAKINYFRNYKRETIKYIYFSSLTTSLISFSRLPSVLQRWPVFKFLVSLLQDCWSCCDMTCLCYFPVPGGRTLWSCWPAGSCWVQWSLYESPSVPVKTVLLQKV